MIKVTANGIYRSPKLMIIRKNQEYLEVAVPPEIVERIVEKEVIKVVPVNPTKEVCESLFPPIYPNPTWWDMCPTPPNWYDLEWVGRMATTPGKSFGLAIDQQTGMNSAYIRGPDDSYKLAPLADIKRFDEYFPYLPKTFQKVIGGSFDCDDHARWYFHYFRMWIPNTVVIYLVGRPTWSSENHSYNMLVDSDLNVWYIDWIQHKPLTKATKENTGVVFYGDL